MPCASIRRKAFAIFEILALGLLAGPVLAAEAWDEKIYNPKPAQGDEILPMPCGGAMVFRRVSIPADGPYSDYQIRVGSSEEARGYTEGARTTHVAGSFQDGKTQRYYLMAKYEVSEAQYEAVMEGSCPARPTLAKRLPKVEIGWMDAVAFADRYSQWLRANAMDKLPREGSESGYLRLPTETEWEFAARGGIKVSPSEFNERLFPMPEGLVRAVWFAGSQSANGKLQLAGLLQPNPLGLHDMLGNADEIVLEPFRLNRLDRPHGQAGAFVVRGGNYLTAEGDIHTAYRQEVPYYEGKGPRRAKTTGMRLVVVAPVITSPDKLRALQSEWARLGAASAPVEKPADDPLDELGLLAKAAPNPQTRARLQNLQTAIRANIALRDEQRDRAVKSSLRLGAFLGRKLGDDARAVNVIGELLKVRLEQPGAADDPRTKDFKAKQEREEAALADNLRYYADTLIRTADDFGEDVLKRQKEILLVELQGMGLAEMKPFVEQHLAHVVAYRKDRKVARSQWLGDWTKMK